MSGGAGRRCPTFPYQMNGMEGAPVYRGGVRGSAIASQCEGPIGKELMTGGNRSPLSVRLVSPTLLIKEGSAFCFLRKREGEPPHVHVRKAGAVAKWLFERIEEGYCHGFNPWGSPRSRVLFSIRTNY